MQTRRIPHPGWNFEYLMFLFTRLSGLAFSLLALIGLSTALFMGARNQMDLGTLMRWTFFPNPNHVLNSNIPDVTMGWANGFWQVMGILILFLGGTHGLNGLRTVLEDYIHPPLLQILIRSLIFMLWAFMLLAAVYVVLAS